MKINQELYMEDMQQFQLFDKYLKWDYDLGRRETFSEAVDRSIEYARFLTKNKLDDEIYELLKTKMLDMSVFPSMRYFQNAGQPAKNFPQSIFNCAYMPMIDLNCFGELLLNLGLGTGQGYSVEKRYVDLLPEVRFNQFRKPENHVVEDSLEGWMNCLNFCIENWFDGYHVNINFSKIRAAGSPLKTRGGTASGPKPFEEALNKIGEIIFRAQGRKLKPIEVHDINCFIASAIVSGGHRRSAMIALFDYNDDEMFECKSGEWYNDKNKSQRAFANNSFVVEESLEFEEWQTALNDIFDNFGEPGVYSRYAAKRTMPYRRSKDFEFGCNPCGEVNLRPFQFCNLSIANIRSDDKPVDVFTKAYVAAIWGTIQSCVEDFPLLRKEWSINQKEERLLGVDLNGQRDSVLFNDETTRIAIMRVAKEVVIETNLKFSTILGINQSTSTTVAKPAGNSSVLFNTASGIAARYAPFYIRRVQCSLKSPVTQFLMAQGVPYAPLMGTSEWSNESIMVFDFPVNSPKDAVTKDNITAIDQLNYWFDVKINYTEHNPSCTIYYEESETSDIINWVYSNQDFLSGITFLPKDTSVHPQMPYEEVNGEKYQKLLLDFPIINWDNFLLYDFSYASEDREFACAGAACDVNL